MKKAIILILLIFLYACVKSPVDIAKQSTEVQDFLTRHPDADSNVVNLNKDQATAFINEIKQACGKEMMPQFYNKVTFNDSDAVMIVYISNDIDCAYTIGDEKPKEPEVAEKVEKEPEAEIQNVKISAYEKSVKEKSFNTIITEQNIQDSLELSFFAECQPWKVQALKIHVNDNLVFDDIPDCEEENNVAVSDISQGEYEITFSTEKGPYTISQFEYAGIYVETFDLDAEPDKITIVNYKEFPLNMEKQFTAPEVDTPILTFDTTITGKLKIVLNGVAIYDREILTPPTLKIEDYLEEENTLKFSLAQYDAICNDVSLEIHMHKDEPVLCSIPEESRIQMIFKNNGKTKIDEVDIFVKGKGTSIDSLNLDLEPTQIFTRVVDHDVGSVDQVILVPITDDIRCKSIVFEDIRTC